MATVTIRKEYGERMRESNISAYEASQHLVKLSSRECEQGGTPSKWVAILDRSFFPDEIRLISFQCNNTVYNLEDPVVLEELGQPPLTLTFPPQIYTATNAAALIAAYLTLVSPSGATYTVTVNQDTLKVAITSTVQFRWLNLSPLNTTYYALGYNNVTPQPAQAFALTQTGAGSYDFLPVIGGILIRIKEMNNAPVGCNSVPYTFLIPTSSVSRNVISYNANPSTAQVYKNSSGGAFASFSVELLQEDGRPLRLNGGITTMQLQFNPRMEGFPWPR